MISEENRLVFGKVRREEKYRIKRIKRAKPEWSESRLIEEALLRFLPEVEKEIPPDHDGPNRKKTAA